MVRVFIISILILQTAELVFAEPTALHSNADSVNVENGARLAHGKKLYEKFCAQCHGLEGQPTAEMSDLFNPPVAPLNAFGYKYGNTLEGISASIKNGRGTAMLSFRDRLSQSQIEAVARYVESLSKPQP